MRLAEFPVAGPPTALSLNSIIPRAPVALVRRPSRCRWSTSRPSPQIHLHCLSHPISHPAAQDMHIAEFQSPEPPTALRLDSTIPRAPVALVRRPPRCRWSTSRYERWLEHLVEAQAQKYDNGSKSTSKCFKCGAIGHWAYDCPASKQDDDTAGQSSSKSEGDYPRVSEATKVKKGLIRKAHTPRVLSKAPPRRQPSIKDCVECMRN